MKGLTRHSKNRNWTAQLNQSALGMKHESNTFTIPFLIGEPFFETFKKQWIFKNYSIHLSSQLGHCSWNRVANRQLTSCHLAACVPHPATGLLNVLRVRWISELGYFTHWLLRESGGVVSNVFAFGTALIGVHHSPSLAVKLMILGLLQMGWVISAKVFPVYFYASLQSRICALGVGWSGNIGICHFLDFECMCDSKLQHVHYLKPPSNVIGPLSKEAWWIQMLKRK